MLIMVNQNLNSEEIKIKLKEELKNLNLKGKIILIDRDNLIKENENSIAIKLKNILVSLPSDYIEEIQKDLALLDLVLKGIGENDISNYIIDFNWVNIFDKIIKNEDISNIIAKSKPKDIKLFELCYFFNRTIKVINDYIKLMGSNSELYNIRQNDDDLKIVNITFNNNLSEKTINLLEYFKTLDKYEKSVEISLKNYIVKDKFLNDKIFRLT